MVLEKFQSRETSNVPSIVAQVGVYTVSQGENATYTDVAKPRSET